MRLLLYEVSDFRDLVHKDMEVRPLSQRTSYVQTVVSCQKQFARQLFHFILQI